MTNKIEMENRIDLTPDTLCPEGIYRAVLRNVEAFDYKCNAGSKSKGVRLVFELLSNEERAVQYLIGRDYYLMFNTGGCLSEDIRCWRGYEITPEEQNQGISFLESLVGWPVDLEIMHISYDRDTEDHLIRRIVHVGKLLKGKRIKDAKSGMDSNSTKLIAFSQNMKNRLAMMQACVSVINNNLDRDTTLQVVRDNLKILNQAIAMELGVLSNQYA